jgi:plasmid stabilization system protein ParE
LIAFTADARRQVQALIAYYEERDRPEAVTGLTTALAAAWERIALRPAMGLAAPRPYPQLAMPGRFWIKSGRYWVGYRREPSLIVVAVFYETANIPGRL